jgi:hypothetical protein
VELAGTGNHAGRPAGASNGRRKRHAGSFRTASPRRIGVRAGVADGDRVDNRGQNTIERNCAFERIRADGASARNSGAGSGGFEIKYFGGEIEGFFPAVMATHDREMIVVGLSGLPLFRLDRQAGGAPAVETNHRFLGETNFEILDTLSHNHPAETHEAD